MAMQKKTTETVVNLIFTGVLTALVVVLQFMGAFIKFGPFSVSLVLVPIVIGAVVVSPLAGAWLGLVFGGVVLWSGDAAAFLAINVPGTVLTVLVKGALAGLAAGLVFRALGKVNRYLAVIAAAVVCPVVNTGVFIVCCLTIFYNAVAAMGEADSFAHTLAFIITGMIGVNFLFELGLNVILGPSLYRIIVAIRGRDKQERAAVTDGEEIEI